MGNMKCLNRKDFGKSHIKKGYKEIGWDYAKIIDRKGDIYLTAPWKGANNGRPNYPEDDGEYIVWNGNLAIAEFLKKEHAVWFFSYLTRRENDGQYKSLKRK